MSDCYHSCMTALWFGHLPSVPTQDILTQQYVKLSWGVRLGDLGSQVTGQWTGRRGPVIWHPKSTNITTHDFFLWRCAQSAVYVCVGQVASSDGWSLQLPITVNPENGWNLSGNIRRDINWTHMWYLRKSSGLNFVQLIISLKKYSLQKPLSDFPNILDFIDVCNWVKRHVYGPDPYITR
jgi:hypothetical protein